MEKQVYQQYLQKVKEQQEERDKLRKVLTTESSKINEQIQENCQAFEQVLTQLHRRRILAQTAVIQVALFHRLILNLFVCVSFLALGGIKNQPFSLRISERSSD